MWSLVGAYRAWESLNEKYPVMTLERGLTDFDARAQIKSMLLGMCLLACSQMSWAHILRSEGWLLYNKVY